MPLKKVNNVVSGRQQAKLSKYEAFPSGGNTFQPGLTKEKGKALVAEFTVIKKVPIFKIFNDEADNINFDEATLERIAAASNKRIEVTRDESPITSGHKKKTNPTPELLGFASNFVVDDLGRGEGKTKAIYCDMKIFTDKLEKVKSLPRRSAEIWADMVLDPVRLETDERRPLDAVALLDPDTRPELDLGLLFEKSGEEARYFGNFEDESMDENQIVKQCVEALCATPEFAFIRELMQKGGDEHNNKEEEAPMPEDKPAFDSEPIKEEEKEAPKDELPKLRLERDEARTKYARLDGEYKALFSRIETLERAKRIGERTASLVQLESEGYMLDRADELATVQDMTEVQFDKHIGRIRKNYSKAPLSIPFVQTRSSSFDGSPEGDKDPYAGMTPRQIQEKAYADFEAKCKGGK